MKEPFEVVSNRKLTGFESSSHNYECSGLENWHPLGAPGTLSLSSSRAKIYTRSKRSPQFPIYARYQFPWEVHERIEIVETKEKHTTNNSLFGRTITLYRRSCQIKKFTPFKSRHQRLRFQPWVKTFLSVIEINLSIGTVSFEE